MSQVGPKGLHASSLDNLGLITGANGEHFEEPTTRPQQFLIGVESHDSHEQGWATTGKDDELRKEGENDIV